MKSVLKSVLLWVMNVGRPEQRYQKGYQTFFPAFLHRRKQVFFVHNEYAGII